MKRFNFKNVYVDGSDSIFHVFIGMFSGVLIISFLLWSRLILIRLPRDLTQDVIYSLRYYIVLSLCISSIFWTIFYIHKIYSRFHNNPINYGFLTFIVVKLAVKLRMAEKKESKYKKTYTFSYKLLEKSFDFFMAYILDGPLYLWKFFHHNGPKNLTDRVKNLSYRLGSFCHYYTKEVENSAFWNKIWITSFIYLPRILAFSVFLYEIAINRKLETFYTIVIILLIPPIFKSLRRIIYDCGAYECEYFEKTYISVPTPDELPQFKEAAIKNKDFWLIPSIESCEGKEAERFVFKKFEHISFEDVERAWAAWQKAKPAIASMYPLFLTDQEQCDIQKLLVSLLLTISFSLWLLIILGLY